jgi:hypothetical protein
VKPTILAVGSCIADYAMKGLAAQPILSEKFDFLYATANVDRATNEFPEDVLRRCVLTIQDVGPWQKKNLMTDREVALLPDDATLIALPGLHFRSPWPLTTTDPRNKPLPKFPWGRYPMPWSDRLAVEVVQEVPDARARLEAYKRKSPLKNVDIERFHEIEIVNMILREQGMDIKVAAMAASSFRKERLYYVYHHPSGQLFHYMLSQILVSEKFRAVHNQSLATLIDGVGRWSVESRVFTDEQVPIHPEIAGALGLSWWRPDLRYRLMGRDWTYDEWIEFYMQEDLPDQA